MLVAGEKEEKDAESLWCKSAGRGLASQCRERLPLVHRDKGESPVVRLSVAGQVKVDQIVLANELGRVNECWPIVVGRVESPQQPHLLAGRRSSRQQLARMQLLLESLTLKKSQSTTA